METFGQADVCEEILPPLGGPRPAGVLQDRLAPQFVGDAEALTRPETRDARSPVGVLGLADGAPIARHELADAAGDHRSIVARRDRRVLTRSVSARIRRPQRDSFDSHPRDQRSIERIAMVSAVMRLRARTISAAAARPPQARVDADGEGDDAL